MPDFFNDNPSLASLLNDPDLRTIVDLQENLYRDAARFDYAPEDYEDAVDTYRRVLTALGKMAADEIAPSAADVDRFGCSIRDGRVEYADATGRTIKRLGQAGMMGFTVSREWGGLNFPNAIFAAATEIVSRADASLMNLFGLQGVAETIEKYGDETQKARYLKPLAEGKLTGAMALTEPDAGSDLGSARLKATQDGERWRLHGVKRFITNGCAEVVLVLARSEDKSADARGLSLFLCEQCPQLKVRRIEAKLGIHGSPTCELQFDGVPAELMGRRRYGLIAYVIELLNGARLAVAAQSVGIAESALRDALAFVETRRQFNSSVRDFPPIRHRLTEMIRKIEGARALVLGTAIRVDLLRNIERLSKNGLLMEHPEGERLQAQIRPLGKLIGCMTSLAKYYAGEICNEVASDAISVMGGSGYMRDYAAERHFRDARITNIYEGTTEMQVIGAIGGIMSGILEGEFERLHDTSPDASSNDIKNRIGEARKLLAETVDFLRHHDDRAYTELSARMVVDIAAEICIAYLLLRRSGENERNRIIAEKHVRDMLPKVRMRTELVRSGDRTCLDCGDVLFRH
ncbi:MAG TPA: acyl-CoA dehydrogenase family protein [Candidatus Brocadiia bacterium]|nr:acyl-CoA dehydrogenase family protein [Candidatus Brocadiia bacterium]